MKWCSSTYKKVNQDDRIMISLASSLILIFALISQPLFNNNTSLIEENEIRLLSRQLQLFSTFQSVDRVSTQLLINEVTDLGYEILERFTSVAPTHVIRDIVRVTLDRSMLARIVDGASALIGFVAIVTAELSQKTSELSGGRQLGTPANLLARSLNATSHLAGLGHGMLSTAFDSYNLVSNMACFAMGQCGRYEFLDMWGNIFGLASTLVNYIVPDIGPYVPVVQTYYSVIIWMYQTADERIRNSTAAIAAATLVGKRTKFRLD